MTSTMFPVEDGAMPQDLSRRRLLVSTAATLALAGVRSAIAASAPALPALSEVFAGEPGPMKVVNYALYVPDRDKVDSSRAEHQAYADALREHDRLVMGGPLLDDDGRPRGVLLVYDVVSKQQAETLAQGDPFVLQGAIADYRLAEWVVTDSNVELLSAALVTPDQRAPREAPHSSPDAHHVRTYVNYARYVSDRSHVERARPAHESCARTLEARGQLIVGGPFADGSGALIVYRARSKAEAAALVREDPYHVEGVFETTALSEWRLFGLNAGLIQSG